MTNPTAPATPAPTATGRYVDQDIFQSDDTTKPAGNCWQACLATLLGLRLEQVPHFVQDEPERWWTNSIEFVHRTTGLALVMATPFFPVYPGEITVATELCIATGPSPRGDFLHSVIADSATGEILHDPHPSRAGLAGPATDVVALFATPILTTYPYMLGDFTVVGPRCILSAEKQMIAYKGDVYHRSPAALAEAVRTGAGEKP